MNTYAAAQQLKAEIAAVVDETAVVVDLDPALINSALAAGRQAITIRPPRVEYPTPTAAEATWTIILITGPVNDLCRAWVELDQMLATISEAIEPDSVTPAEYQTATGTRWPAFSVDVAIPYNL